MSAWFLLVCRECWPEATHESVVGEMPFVSAEERGRWADEHKRGTGHDRWIVLDVPSYGVTP